MDKKVERIIKLYSQFLEGKVINKRIEAERFEVNQRTIQRDIDDIRMYFANDMNVNWQVVYERNKNGYVLVRDKEESLNSQEILVLCSVFMKSRALVKEEMFSVVDKLVQICNSNDEKKKLLTLLSNEKKHYKNPEHGKKLEQIIKNLGDAIYTHKLLQIDYVTEDSDLLRSQVIEPMGIVFSKNYFYLTAYMVSDIVESESKNHRADKRKSIYRLDRIKEYKVLQEHFHVPYQNRHWEDNFIELIEQEIAISEEESGNKHSE